MNDRNRHDGHDGHDRHACEEFSRCPQHKTESEIHAETSEAWEHRHAGHLTEEWTPEKPFETRSLYCHDCDEAAEWRGNKKINRE